MADNSDTVIQDLQSTVDSVSTDDTSATPLHEIESLCMRCGENGTTRLLLTRIPHFREVVLMAFECPHCNERNNEIQFSGVIQPKGSCYQLKVPSGDANVLNRQVVKSDSATIRIPELDFEIPPSAQRGILSTVEGILLRAAEELEALQDERKKVAPETAEAIDQFLVKLRSYAAGDASFTFILDDPAGNSYIENPSAPSSDPLLSVRFYERTQQQQIELGYLTIPTSAPEVDSTSQNAPHGSVGAVSAYRSIAQSNTDDVSKLYRYAAPEEVDTLPSTCGACGAACETRFYATRIPYFREVIIMASSCDLCGYRNSELKAGGEIPDKAKKITLHVESINDFSRDVIKSDSARVVIPEIDLELTSGTMGGMVTTVEGLITKISEKLDTIHGLQLGDSTDKWKKVKWQEFKSRLLKLLEINEPWTLILDDALASSFISPLTDAIEDDKQLVVEEYERSWEQKEELGLNDMDTSAADAAYNIDADQ